MLNAPLQLPREHDYGSPPDHASKYTAAFGWSLRLADLGVLVVAGMLAYWLRFGTLAIDIDYQRSLIRSVVLGVGIFSLSPLYRSWRGRGLASELLTMCATYSVMFTTLVLYTVALKFSTDHSRLWRVMWFASSLAGGVGVRVVIRSVAAWTRRRGMDLRTAVVVGGSHDAARIVDALRRNRSAGIKLVGRFQTGDTGLRISDVPYLGDLGDMVDYVEQQHVNQVWIALPVSEQQQINRILEALAFSTADIKFVPDLFGLQLISHSVEQIAGLPVINLRASPLNGDAKLVKAIENGVLASLILVLVSPLLVVIAIGVKLSSPGPILFRQKRHGLGGNVIEVWKFRTMRVHHEADGQVTQAIRFDQRVTRFGRFLRRTSLDELPQFFNVLQGTMAVVGPRPHAIEHNHHYKTVVQDYMQRHRIKPGITGWAQVNGLRGETNTVDKMKARVQYDLHYMQNWSVPFDLKIVALTVFKGFFDRNVY